MEPFTYNPFNNPKEEFRLLRLHPGSPKDELRCDLEHVEDTLCYLIPGATPFRFWIGRIEARQVVGAFSVELGQLLEELG